MRADAIAPSINLPLEEQDGVWAEMLLQTRCIGEKES